MFEGLIGNLRAKAYLQKLLDSNSIPHALLFSGSPGVGKALFAKAFAAQLIGVEGEHPDLHEYFPEGKIGAHSIDSMRALMDEVSLAPYKAPWKVFIIHEAERMLQYSANALLKTFEEPSARTVIILLSSYPELLIPTILSRCRTLPFQAIPPEEIAAFVQQRFSLSPETAQDIAQKSKGSLAEACRLVEQGKGLFENHLVPVLSKGGFASFNELSRTAKALAEKIDLLKEDVEAPPSEIEMTAVQKNQWEKAQAGGGAVRYAQQAAALFEGIAGWFRDMHLLHYNGKMQALWHAKYKNALLQSIQSGHLRELDLVLAALKEATLSLQRSTPLQSILETLFLRLKLL